MQDNIEFSEYTYQRYRVTINHELSEVFTTKIERLKPL